MELQILWDTPSSSRCTGTVGLGEGFAGPMECGCLPPPPKPVKETTASHVLKCEINCHLTLTPTPEYPLSGSVDASNLSEAAPPASSGKNPH